MKSGSRPVRISKLTLLFGAPDEDHNEAVLLRSFLLQALHVRVIALESLVVALLSWASEHGKDAARELASWTSPRSGFTPHPLTTHAATHVLDLIERAKRFHDRKPEV